MFGMFIDAFKTCRSHFNGLNIVVNNPREVVDESMVINLDTVMNVNYVNNCLISLKYNYILINFFCLRILCAF